MAGFGTDMANAAMVHLGQRAIADIDDPEDLNATRCKAHLRSSIAVVSRSHPWNVLCRRESIGADAEAPAFGFAYRYTLPAACVRVLKVNEDPNAAWRKEGDRSLVTDLPPPLNIEYLSDGSEVGTISDPLAAELVAVYLAWKICLVVTQDKSLKAALWDSYQDLRRDARTADGQEGIMQEEEECIFLTAMR